MSNEKTPQNSEPVVNNEVKQPPEHQQKQEPAQQQMQPQQTSQQANEQTRVYSYPVKESQRKKPSTFSKLFGGCCSSKSAAAASERSYMIVAERQVPPPVVVTSLGDEKRHIRDESGSVSEFELVEKRLTPKTNGILKRSTSFHKSANACHANAATSTNDNFQTEGGSRYNPNCNQQIYNSIEKNRYNNNVSAISCSCIKNSLIFQVLLICNFSGSQFVELELSEVPQRHHWENIIDLSVFLILLISPHNISRVV